MHGEFLSFIQKSSFDDALVRRLSNPPVVTGDFEIDAAAHGPLWAALDEIERRLRGGAGADGANRAILPALRDYATETRERFLARHVDELYRRLTKDYRSFVRVERLVLDAGQLVPGLAPTEAMMAEQRKLALADKHGLELQQGLLLGKIAASPKAGSHLCHAMLLPRAESGDALAKFRRDGFVDFDRARIERRGSAAVVVMSQPQRLNCEDETTYRALETAVDVALMDPDIKIGVLRGDRVSHPKHAGRRLFGSGINLTALHSGQVSYMFYVARDLGAVNKMHRGLARPDRDPSEIGGGTVEKLWIAVVEGFAIGGACQLLLVMDHIIAERGAYLSLPARKEGIIPGMANLRLPRLVGDRLARQAILNDRRIDCDSLEGRTICDDIVEPADIEATIDRTVEALTASGVISASGNRRALRVGAEPLDLFCRYFAVYAREQAYCHVSPALVANLERHWHARKRQAG